MKKKILSLLVAISVAITSLTLISCDLVPEIENGEVKGIRYENSENYLVGNCSLNYDEFDLIEVNWVLGDIVVKKTENAVVNIKENVEESLDAYKMHYIVEDRVLKVQFWESGYKAYAQAEEKALTIELPATVNTDITINTVLSNITCQGELRSDFAEFDTVSGIIEIDDIKSSSLKVNSVSGNINISSATANDISVANISGNIDLSVKAVKELEVSTISGNVGLKLNDVGATVEFDTVSGKYTAKDGLKVFGDGLAKISVETISGNLTIN